MVTEQDIAVLSSAPWFDIGTAHDLLSLVRPTSDESETRGILSALNRTGLLIHSDKAWSVREPLRTEGRQGLAGREPTLYDAALTVFSTHAENGFGSALASIMGSRGAELNVLAISAARGDSSGSFNELVTVI